MTPEEPEIVDNPEGAETKIVLVRVVEWGEWLPLYSDESYKQLALAEGITGFEAFKSERLVNLDVMNTHQIHHFPMTDPEGATRNVKHGFYAFQAVLASSGTVEQMPQGPKKEGGPQTIVLPEQKTRAQRRSNNNKGN